jgi:hypothetical protein
MHPINLIASAIENDPERPELPCDPVYGICAITGDEGLCVPRKKLFGKSFTNSDLMICPASDMVSVNTYLALKYKWERMSSWICDGKTFTKLTRVEVREHVLSKQKPEIWTGYVTTSYKKHGALNAAVNRGKSNVWLFEMRKVDCSEREIMMAWWHTLNSALRSGIWRSVIESLECPGAVMKNIGIRAWCDFERWARPRYQSSLYAFLTYLLPSQEELKNEHI